MNNDPTLTIADVAPRLGRSVEWLTRHARELPHHRIGRFIRFNEDDVQAIIKLTEKRPEKSSPESILRPLSRRRAS